MDVCSFPCFSDPVMSECCVCVPVQLRGGPDVSHLLVPVQQEASVEGAVPGTRPGAPGLLPQRVFVGETLLSLPRLFHVSSCLE